MVNAIEDEGAEKHQGSEQKPLEWRHSNRAAR